MSISMIPLQPVSHPFPVFLCHSILRTFMHSMRCILYHWKCWKAPARMHSNWWTQELKFLCLFHFNFKHSSFTLNRMPSTTIVSYFVCSWCNKNHESESILQKFIFCILSFSFSFFALFAYRKLSSLCSFIRWFCTPVSLSLSLSHSLHAILIPFRITFVIPLLPFTETMTWLHNMQSAQHAG